MPGPNSFPLAGKTARDVKSGKANRRMANKHRCAIRESGGKFRGTHNCDIHPSK